MQKQPLISFIITIYNTDTDMLHKCLESIMALSLSQMEREVIVVDDGSDMTPLNDIADYSDSIIYIRQRNQGPSAARNIALKMANGRYIQFVNGDDSLIRAPYEHCLDIARYHNPDVVLFKTTANANNVETPFTYDGPKTGSDYMRNNSMRGSVCNFLFERKILGTLRFPTDVYHDDDEFTTQLLIRSERLYTTDSDAYCDNGSKAQQTTHGNESNNERLFADTERVLQRLQNLVVPDTDRAALNRRIAQITMEYLCNIIRRTHNRHLLAETMERLRDKGLYPLPDRDYSKRYKYFRKMIGNALTRNLLFLLIRK